MDVASSPLVGLLVILGLFFVCLAICLAFEFRTICNIMVLLPVLVSVLVFFGIVLLHYMWRFFAAVHLEEWQKTALKTMGVDFCILYSVTAIVQVGKKVFFEASSKTPSVGPAGTSKAFPISAARMFVGGCVFVPYFVLRVGWHAMTQPNCVIGGITFALESVAAHIWRRTASLFAGIVRKIFCMLKWIWTLVAKTYSRMKFIADEFLHWMYVNVYIPSQFWICAAREVCMQYAYRLVMELKVMMGQFILETRKAAVSFTEFVSKAVQSYVHSVMDLVSTIAK